MKNFILILFLLVSINCFSATRQEIQVALDLVKYVNVANDIIDGLPEILRSELTIEEKKEQIILMGTNIRNYKSRVDKFLSKAENRTKAINGLNAWGVDKEDLKDDLILIDTTINNIKSNISNIKTQDDLNTIAEMIESTITKLPLIRKAK